MAVARSAVLAPNGSIVINGETYTPDQKDDVKRRFTAPGRAAARVLARWVANSDTPIRSTAVTLKSTGEFLAALGNPHLWKRMGVMFLGILCFYFAIWLMVADTKAGKAVTSAVKTVSTKGVL